MDFTIPSHITPEVFLEFAWFDLLHQQRRHRAPLIFAAVMAGFASICFLMSGRVRGAGLLGGVLLGVGLVLPFGWLLSFHLSLRAEGRRLKLAQSPETYTLRLTDRGLTVTKDSERADFSWDSVLRVCRLRHCVCLYTAPRQAFLLPVGDIPDVDRLWQRLVQKLPAEKVRDFQR